MNKDFNPVYHFSFKPNDQFLMGSMNEGVYELNVIQKTVAKVMKGVQEEKEKALYLEIFTTKRWTNERI